MTIEEWTKTISDELRAAGFEVTEYQGFPLVRPNMDDSMAGHMERVRLLKFRPSLSVSIRMYAEGALYVPAGSWEKAQELQRADEGRPQP